jgi:predicted nucleotidyltransferase
VCYIADKNRDEIIAKLRETAPALKAEGVTALAIFGSRARGDARQDSDLDVLIDIANDEQFSLLDLIGVQHIIQDATGLPTQATLRGDVDKRFASRIADDVIEIF